MSKYAKKNEPSSPSNHYQKHEPSSSSNYYQDQKSNPESEPPPADRPKRPKGNPEPLKINFGNGPTEFDKSFFLDGLYDNKPMKTKNEGKHYVCEKCSKIFNDDNWNEWPEGGCCNGNKMKKT